MRELRFVNIQLKFCNLGFYGKVDYDTVARLVERKINNYLGKQISEYYSPEFSSILRNGGFIWKVKDATEFLAQQDRFAIGLMILRLLLLGAADSEAVKAWGTPQFSVREALREIRALNRTNRFADVVEELVLPAQDQRWTIQKCRNYLGVEGEKRDIWKQIITGKEV